MNDLGKISEEVNAIFLKFLNMIVLLYFYFFIFLFFYFFQLDIDKVIMANLFE